MTEAERLRDFYRRRAGSAMSRLYSPLNAAGLFTFQERERALLGALAMITDTPDRLAQLRVLDVGCGTGGLLQDFVRYGATPALLCGIDLLESRVIEARTRYPHLDTRCANAEELPFADGSFDLVLCFTLFDTILDTGVRGRVSREILRVLKACGRVLLYDFRWNNPANPDVRKVTRQEIEQLFDGCECRLRRVTLAPPIARRVAAYSPMLAGLLAKIPFLCSHYIGIIRRPERERRGTSATDVMSSSAHLNRAARTTAKS